MFFKRIFLFLFAYLRFYAFVWLCFYAFGAFWYVLVPCILLVLFMRVKSCHEKKKKKKFKTVLITSFILLLISCLKYLKDLIQSLS